MAVIETGYGSPSTGGFLTWPAGVEVEHLDYGYGTPTSFLLGVLPPDLEAYQDTGYGSPYASITVQFPAAGLVVPDDGGFVVRLAGNWPKVGPYQVSITDADGEIFRCHTVAFGKGGPFDCWTDDDANQLRFGTPRCHVGTYDLTISWLEGGLQEAAYPASVTVERRTLHPTVYTERAGFPRTPFRRVIGPRSITGQPVKGA